jgi:hypothetical protein
LLFYFIEPLFGPRSVFEDEFQFPAGEMAARKAPQVWQVNPQ